MGIGQRIETWLRNLPPWSWCIAYFDSVKTRRRAVIPQMKKTTQDYLDQGKIGDALLVQLMGTAFIFLGDIGPTLKDAISVADMAAGAPDFLIKQFSHILIPALKNAASSEIAADMAELVGAVVTEPVVDLLMREARNPSADPMTIARKFHGIASGLPWAAETIDSILKAKWGEHAPQVGKNIMALYWGLGLGFLGWQTLAPLLSTGIQPGLERHFNREFQPARFTPAQITDLYGLGMRSQSDLTEALKDLGWRDQDIQAWVKLSYRSLSEGGLWDLYHKGQIDKPEMDKRLRAFGYDPADLPMVYLINEKAEVTESTASLYSTAKSAYRSKLINEAEFRQILTSLKHTPREIDLQVQLIQADWVIEGRQLTSGQIKELYNQRILGVSEATHRLVEQEYLPEDAADLIKAWDAEAVPKAARINRGTILQGYTQGVLSEKEAIDLLRTECGYDSTKAQLIVKIEKASAPTPPILGPQGAAPATLTMLSQWATAGLITKAQVLARPELERYNVTDRQRIADQMFLVEPSQAPQVNAGMLLEAYVHGVLERATVTTRLIALKYSAADTELMIKTAEANNPQVFAPVTPAAPAELGLSTLSDFAAAGLITRTEYEARPELSKYTKADRTKLADLTFAEAATAPVELSDSLLVAAFVYEVITEQGLTERLRSRGLSDTDIGLAIETIKLENPQVFGVTPRALLKQPSVGSVQLAYQRGLIDEAGFSGRLTSMGYTEDAVLMFRLNAEYQAPANPKQLTQAQVISLYKNEDISRGEAGRRMIELGYTVADAELLIKAQHKMVADTEAAAWFEAGLLDITGFSAIVTDLGFTVEEIDAYLSQFEEV